MYNEAEMMKITIENMEKDIARLGEKRMAAYRKVQDFTKADYVATEKALNVMAECDRKIKKIQKEIRKIKKKFK